MTYVIPHKYFVTSPFTTPECYNPSSEPSQNKVRCLFIPSDKHEEPMIITDYFSVIIETFFQDYSPSVLQCAHNFHVYYDQYLQMTNKFPNFVATTLIRQDTLTFNGDMLSDSINGNVFVFGTVNPLTNIADNKSYSVPYEIIEQAVRIYESNTS